MIGAGGVPVELEGRISFGRVSVSGRTSQGQSLNASSLCEKWLWETLVRKRGSERSRLMAAPLNKLLLWAQGLILQATQEDSVEMSRVIPPEEPAIPNFCQSLREGCCRE